MSTDSHISSLPPLFNLIVDSGCTHHMFILRKKFITYKPTPNSYVILANKSKVACLGSGTVSFTLFIENIILHDVLHVPKLCSPLLSVRCFPCLPGCSFIADNNGSFLTFPQFILPVNDSSDCTIAGSFCNSPEKIHFDSIVGSISNVSENTCFRHQRLPVLPNKSSKLSNNLKTSPLHEDLHPKFLPMTTSNTNTLGDTLDLP